MKLNLIYARAANGVIGQGGQIPWHLPEDLAHFKRMTQGHPVIMGRKTWDSLPPKFRPLPGRRNVVVTHQDGWQAPGAEVVHSVQDAIAACGDVPEVWVIGGAQIYALTLPLADAVVVTEIEREYEGDAYAPTLTPEWRQVSRERHVNADGLAYSFVRLAREPNVNG